LILIVELNYVFRFGGWFEFLVRFGGFGVFFGPASDKKKT
jgi:hypothetical protein